MSTWQVTKRLTGEVVYAYTADEPVEWPGMEFSTHNHLLQVQEIEPETTDADWRIYVGAFFDRFGDQKIGILSSEDAVVQALIKDASVRQYIGLRERRDELAQMIGVLVAKGFTLDAAAILDTEPTEAELWQPSIR